MFVLRAVAQTARDARDAVGESTLMAIGFVSAASLFALGRLVLCGERVARAPSCPLGWQG